MTQQNEGPELIGFLLAHAGMRQEFGLLANAARESLDPGREKLVEDQIALVLDVLHHHHQAEDDTIWPWLRERVPAAREGLDELEADHEQLDPLISSAGDRRTALIERAPILAELHERVNAHLDREEALAVPLIEQHVSREEWDELGKRAVKDMGRKNIPVIYGWYASAVDERRVAEALATVPWIVRVMFRRIWWPAYRKRALRLYGAQAPAGVLR